MPGMKRWKLLPGALRCRARRFLVVRHEDVHEVSGVGIVAEGIRFWNGKAVLCWIGETSSVSQWDSVEDAIRVHGHDGRTVVEWLDEGWPEPVAPDVAEKE